MKVRSVYEQDKNGRDAHQIRVESWVKRNRRSKFTNARLDGRLADLGDKTILLLGLAMTASRGSSDENSCAATMVRQLTVGLPFRPSRSACQA